MQSYEVFAGRRYICNIFPSDLAPDNACLTDVLHQMERELRIGPLTLVSVGGGYRDAIYTTEPETADRFEDVEFEFEDSE